MIRASLFSAVAAISFGLATPLHAELTEAQRAERAASDEQNLRAFMANSDVRRLMVSVDNGDAFSMVRVADMIDQQLHSKFYDFDKLLQMRMKLYAGAMAKGYGPAFHRVGMLIKNRQTPEGTPMDAFNYFRQGAEKGDADSLYEYARLAFDPDLCTRCRPYARGEKFDSTGLLGNGQPAGGTSLWEASKREYLREKVPMAQAALARLETIDVTRHSAAVELLNSVYLDGVRRPSYVIDVSGSSMVLAPQPDKARRLMEGLAASGDVWANKLLALIYINGNKEGFAKNPGKFLSYMERAAQAGDVQARALLGHEQVAGNKVPVDLVNGEKWIRLAHQGGTIDATVDLGVMYMSGRGVTKDEAMAADLFGRAADRGSSKAAEYAATLWESGINGTRNPLRAFTYREQAKRNAETERQAKARQETLQGISGN
ncbi:MAG: tetratricopeptide repeat protein [Novosphingobium sp.]